MMIKRQGNKIVYHCEACGAVEETGTEDFFKALDVIRAKKWKMQKKHDEWLHFCSPECWLKVKK
jgi:uncharacterized Zn finger protein